MQIQPLKRYSNGLLALEIGSTSRYFNRLFQLGRLPHDEGFLFDAVPCAYKAQLTDESELPDLTTDPHDRSLILYNGVFNHHLDIEQLLAKLKTRLSRHSRVMVVAYNPYLRALYSLANRLGLRKGETPFTFLTHTDLVNVSKLAGFEVVRVRPAVYCPFRLLGLGTIINKLMPALPLLRHLGLASLITLRPVIAEIRHPSLTIVIPARNEKGNIENALKRLPNLNAEMEVIFVEGHSSDDTWDEIQRVIELYKGNDKFKLKAFQQSGNGKNDAVHKGFEHAEGELLTILDADLTMPPELLARFYEAYCKGLADFINGNRLLYPMEGEAMKPLNRLGNIFFAKALSTTLDANLGDSLCGTKLLTSYDWHRCQQWRDDFGDFDPFGDYELLFPAAVLGLGIVDIPVRYLDRTYGSTNISRFRHGAMLLKMTLVGLFHIKLGRV